MSLRSKQDYCSSTSRKTRNTASTSSSSAGCFSLDIRPATTPVVTPSVSVTLPSSSFGARDGYLFQDVALLVLTPRGAGYRKNIWRAHAKSLRWNFTVHPLPHSNIWLEPLNRPSYHGGPWTPPPLCTVQTLNTLSPCTACSPAHDKKLPVPSSFHFQVPRLPPSLEVDLFREAPRSVCSLKRRYIHFSVPPSTPVRSELARSISF